MSEIGDIIKAYGDNGEEIKLELIDVLNIGENKYVIAGPIDGEEAYAYKVISRENGMVEYASIGAGREFNKVLTAYNAKQNN